MKGTHEGVVRRGSLRASRWVGCLDSTHRGRSFLWLMALLLAMVGLYTFFLLSQEALAFSEYLSSEGVADLDPGYSALSPAQIPTGASRRLVTVTPTATLTATPTVPPSITPTATLIPFITPADPLPSPTPMPSVPVSQTIPNPTAYVSPGQVTSLLASAGLWGIEQSCTAGPIADAGNSIDLAFNDWVAWCGPFGGGDSWTYTALQHTSFATIARATLDVRFYLTGLSNDGVDLEVNNGLGWQPVATFLVASPPPGVLTTLSYEVSSLFTTPAEVNAVQVRFIASAHGPADPIVIYLDEVRLNVDDVIPTPTPLPPLPTPTLPPPLPTVPAFPGDPHVDYGATTSSCAGCHRAHTASGIVLRQAWPEENVCFGCHAGSGPGTDVLGAFANYTNTDTRFFKHDIAATNGVHRLGQMSGIDFGGAQRHVECEDCHEPHDATRGETSPPSLQREMTHAPGVDPVWSGPGAPFTFAWLPQAEREYQVCFKCHSSFTDMPTYIPDGWDGSTYVADGLRKLTYSGDSQVPDSRDMAAEFNPYNASFHPVVTLGAQSQHPRR